MSDLDTKPLSVSALNSAARLLLEQNFPPLWVEGEISNLVTPASGHSYFSLKDANAQVRCAMFRMRKSRLTFTPENGMLVRAFAKVSLYEGRGDFQLIIESLEEAGDGKLQQAFERLKKALATEGLFKPECKKPIPIMPKQIGIITSSTGAAVRDIIKVLSRRFPSIPVVIYPTLVQGGDAPPKIINAIEAANQRNECDVLLLARGGGSLEDLWAFNDEGVARAIFTSKIPIISGIGHEIDFTIADFVADLRAATPSAAAEHASPDQEKWLHQLQQFSNRLIHNITIYFQQCQQHVQHLHDKLQHPGQKLQQMMQRVDHLQQGLVNAQTRIIEQQCAHLANLSRALNNISPLNTLDRGYAIALHNDEVIDSINKVKPKDKVMIKVSDGNIEAVVTESTT